MESYYNVISVIGFLILISNLSIIIGVFRDPKLRKQVFTLQIAFQALTDLLVGLLILVFQFGTVLNGYEFVGKSTGCEIYAFCIVGSCHLTLFSLSSIAYCRRKRVLENINVETKTVAKLSAVSLVLSAALGCFYKLVSKGTLQTSGAFCNPIYGTPVLIVCGGAVFLPIFYIVVTYRSVNRIMQKTMGAVKVQTKRKVIPSSFVAGAKTALTLGRPKTPVDSAQNKRDRAQRRATRLMIMMSFSILGLWLPLYVNMGYTSYEWLFSGKQLPGLQIAEISLGVSAALSSLASPLLYGLTNRTLRIAMAFAFLPSSWKTAFSDDGFSFFRKRLRGEVQQDARLMPSVTTTFFESQKAMPKAKRQK